MTIFAVELEKDAYSEHFIEATRKNFLFQDFFNGHIKQIERAGSVWCLFWVKVPLGFPFATIGFIVTVASFLLRGWSWWLVVGPLFLLPYVLETRLWWYANLFIQLRKYGYKGKLRLVKNSELLVLVMDS